MTPEAVRAQLAAAGVTESCALVGVRARHNQIGVYDDHLYVVARETFQAFRANTDPSRQAPRMATLMPGVWQYRLGIHGLSRPKAQQYEALVQAAPVTVRRFPVSPGSPYILDTGWFGINIHRGGDVATSSLGCQTIYRPEWPVFLALVKGCLLANEQRVIPYLLCDAVA